MPLETIETSVAELEKPSTTTVRSVVDRILLEIKRLSVDLTDPLALNQILDIYKTTQQVEIGFVHLKAFILATMKKSWESLPNDFKKRNGFTFEHFATLLTGRQRSTINNYIRTAEVWLVDGVKAPDPIMVVSRTEDGRPKLAATGEQMRQAVNFDPFQIDMSKLLVLNARAADGNMTGKLWEMLVDPFVSVDELNAESQTGSEGKTYEHYFEVVGPGLYYTEGIHTVELAYELNWEGYEHDPIVKKAMDSMFARLGVILDGEKIATLTKQIPAKESCYEV